MWWWEEDQTIKNAIQEFDNFCKVGYQFFCCGITMTVYGRRAYVINGGLQTEMRAICKNNLGELQVNFFTLSSLKALRVENKK